MDEQLLKLITVEEKLVELIKKIMELSEKSNKYYAELIIDGCCYVEISIRGKTNFKYIETRKIYTEEAEANIDELIEFLDKYEVK